MLECKTKIIANRSRDYGMNIVCKQNLRILIMHRYTTLLYRNIVKIKTFGDKSKSLVYLTLYLILKQINLANEAKRYLH